MGKKRILATCLALGCLWPAASAFASPEGRNPRLRERAPRSSPQERREQVQNLQLTDAQRQAIRERRAAYRKRMIELKSQLELRRVDRDTELEKTNPDKAKLQKLSEEIGRIRGQMIGEETNAKVDFEKLLTPEQARKWREMKKSRRGKGALDSLEYETD